MNTSLCQIKRIYPLILYILLSFFPHSNAWAKTVSSTNGFGSTLTGSISSNVCAVGEMIMLDLSLTNNVAGIIQTSSEPIFGAYKYVVVNEHGQTIPMTTAGKQWYHNMALSGGKRRPLRLKKDEGFDTKIELATFFDLTLEGLYTVNVTAVFVSIQDSQITKGKLELPPLKFKIIPISHAP